MSLLIYNIFLKAYRAGIAFASLFDQKARNWVRGRQKFPERENRDQTIWMHCASLGEFEQGKPVLEAIKKEFPGFKVILTFWSPSGYEIRKNYPGADAVYYLPTDSPKNASRFLDLVNPAIVIWVRYDYWYYYLHEISKRKLPFLLISAVFRPSQPFFKWYGKLWGRMLQCFTHIFVQNRESLDLIQSHFRLPVTVSGDTRFDRVTDIAVNWKDNETISAFCKGHVTIVAGSTWEEDEEEWIHYARTHSGMRFIMAPHLVDEKNIREVEGRFPGCIRFSALTENPGADAHVVVIDNIGMLSMLYRYADICYVGGGFGNSGLHNILEAAVYGKPVIIGPVYQKHFEAEELIRCGGAFTVNNALALEQQMNELINSPESIKMAGRAAEEYVRKNVGATSCIMDHIRENRLLTSASN